MNELVSISGDSRAHCVGAFCLLPFIAQSVLWLELFKQRSLFWPELFK